MQVPKDFYSESTFQYTGYYHPHEEGITYTNKEFEDIFRNRYFVPDYIRYLSNGKGSPLILEQLMSEEEFVNLGILYMRSKSILMMFEHDSNFMNEFVTLFAKKMDIIMKRKLLNLKCVEFILNNKLPNQTDLSKAFEYIRITTQLLMINIIAATIKEGTYTNPVDSSVFMETVYKFNKAYENMKTQMQPWNVAIAFFVNFGGAMCVVEELFDNAYEMLKNEDITLM
jgi:hypothetical protein